MPFSLLTDLVGYDFHADEPVAARVTHTAATYTFNKRVMSSYYLSKQKQFVTVICNL